MSSLWPGESGDGPPHDALGEPREVVGALGLEGEEVQDLGQGHSHRFRRLDGFAARSGIRVRFDVGQVHRIHVRSCAKSRNVVRDWDRPAPPGARE